jgi:hypothetical protein
MSLYAHELYTYHETKFAAPTSATEVMMKEYIDAATARVAAIMHAANAEKMLEAFKEDIRATVLAKIEVLVFYGHPSAIILNPACLKKQYECGHDGVPGHCLIDDPRSPFDEVVDEFARSGWKLENISALCKSSYIVWRILYMY